MKTQNLNGKIHVNNIDIIVVASFSLVQIGSNEHMLLETRLKHLRHLTIPPKATKNDSNEQS